MSEIFSQVIKILQSEVTGIESLGGLGIGLSEEAAAIIAPEFVIPALLAFGVMKGISSASVNKIKKLQDQANQRADRNPDKLDILTKSRAQRTGSLLGKHVRGRLEAGGGFGLKDPPQRARHPTSDGSEDVRPPIQAGPARPIRPVDPRPLPPPADGGPVPFRPAGTRHQIRKRQRFREPLFPEMEAEEAGDGGELGDLEQRGEDFLREEKKERAQDTASSEQSSRAGTAAGVAAGVAAAGVAAAAIIKDRLKAGDARETANINKDLPQADRQQDINNIVRDSLIPRTGFQDASQQLSAETIKPNPIFQLPDDSQSSNSVELVRLTNANYNFQNNLFNTKF